MPAVVLLQCTNY